ncbi:MAG: hypothetical protein MUF14_00200 [Hyphomonadaceae bacterium]|nr:hypothetical protein [Hyphomonadaceae bacterium]
MTGFRPSRLTSALVDLGLMGCSLVAGLAGLPGLFMAFGAGAAAGWWLNTRQNVLAAMWADSQARTLRIGFISILLIAVVHGGVFAVGAYIHERLT